MTTRSVFALALSASFLTTTILSTAILLYGKTGGSGAPQERMRNEIETLQKELDQTGHATDGTPTGL